MHNTVPIAILVETEHPHNIGFCARAVSCYEGLDLRLVRAGSSEVPKEAFVTGAPASEVMAGIRVFPTLREALADCSLAVGFSRRVFDTVLPSHPLHHLPAALPAGSRPAFVFGRESTGLRLEELALCSCQCEIPLPGRKSFNLGQAVAIALYGWFTHAASASAPATESPGAVGIEDMERLVEFVAGQTDPVRTSVPKVRQVMRKLLQRMGPDRGEMDALYGILRSLSGQRARTPFK